MPKYRSIFYDKFSEEWAFIKLEKKFLNIFVWDAFVHSILGIRGSQI